MNSHERELYDAATSRARKTYPQYADRTDAFVLAMLVSNHMNAEGQRSEYMRLNAWQAHRIGVLELQLKGILPPPQETTP